MPTYLFLNQGFFDITIYQYGYENCKPLHSFGPAMRNHYLIHYIVSGSGTFSNNPDDHEKAYVLHTGDAFLIEPNKIVHYTADAKTPWTYMWIEFDGLKAKEYLTSAGLTYQSPIYAPESPMAAINVFSYLEYIVKHPDLPAPEIMGYTYLFFNALICSSANRILYSGNHIREYYIQSAVSYIEEHYMQDITVENIAECLNLERSYFSKLFKKMTQKSPQEFLIQYRINKSCELLRTTNMTIAQVSESIGYSNQFHFSRAFKKLMGTSPQQWRRQHRNPPR